MKEPLPTLAEFIHRAPIQTRWSDNDAYGHVNNVIYYLYFDTLINAWLTAEGGLDVAAGPVIGVCVESGCRYLGRSSVRYELGIFRGEQLCAHGHFVHVFVDRESRRPTDIPPALRGCLERLKVS